jgi:hypothetical protein
MVTEAEDVATRAPAAAEVGDIVTAVGVIGLVTAPRVPAVVRVTVTAASPKWMTVVVAVAVVVGVTDVAAVPVLTFVPVAAVVGWIAGRGSTA